MTGKVCSEPRDMDDHSECRAALATTARRGRANVFVPPELGDGVIEDLRDVAEDIYIPVGEDYP